MKRGDRVVLQVLPPWIGDLPEESQQAFRLCVGRVYEVTEVDANGLVVLDVSADVDPVLGGAMHDLRVESEFVRLVDGNS